MEQVDNISDLSRLEKKLAGVEREKQELKAQLEELRKKLTDQEQTESALRESEKKYRSFFEQAAVGIGRVKFDDVQWIDVNDAFCNMVGYELDELLSLTWPLITHPKDVERDMALFKKMATGKLENYSIEKRFIHKKGHHVWARLTLSLVRDEQGQPDYEIAVIEDITKRKKAEKALLRSEERWNLAIENFAEGVIIATEDEQVIYWNPAAREMHGFTRQNEGIEPLEKTPQTFELWTPDGNHLLELDNWPMRRIKRGEKVTNYELRLRRPDQEWEKFVSYSGSMVETSGGEKLIFLSVHDLTEQWKAIEALRESEDRFRTLANNISQLAWMADGKGWLFWYNQRWYDYTGTTFEEMQGWGWKQVHHPDHVDRVVTKVQHAWDTGEVWEDLFPIRGKDGNYRWFLSRAIPIRNSEGDVMRWFGTNTDVTEQREIEKQLKKDNELFENLFHLIAHDLKAPVANLQMALNMIKVVGAEKKSILLDQFGHQVFRLDKTLTGISEIVSVRKKYKASVTNVYFENVLNDVLFEYKDELPGDSIAYNFSRKSIRYIEAFLTSIMRNLIDNAIKYKRNNEPLKIEITSTSKKGYILLMVKDNGIGIDLNLHKEKLFTPFLRIDPYKTSGTGVGLYIIKNIIENNGGTIELESTPGKGTTFLCYLKEYK